MPEGKIEDVREQGVSHISWIMGQRSKEDSFHKPLLGIRMDTPSSW